MKNIFEYGRECNLVVIGGYIFIFYIIWNLISIAKRLAVYFFPPNADFVKFADDGYALITGAAGGIGKAMADEFGKLGIKLFLIDINESLLEKTRRELEKKYPKNIIKTKAMDLRDLVVRENYEKFQNEIGQLKIGILFNCAGIAEYKVFRFCSNTHENLVSLNEINCTAPTLLCHAILPQMVERRNGLVMIMSSASALSPLALLPVYGATKSYALHLSESLQRQFPYDYSGIYFHAFHPQFVNTPMTQGWVDTVISSTKLFPRVEDWVPEALKSIQSHPGHSVGWLWHEFAVWFQVNCANLADAVAAEPRLKNVGDTRFKHCVVDEQRTALFRSILKDTPELFDDYQKNK